MLRKAPSERLLLQPSPLLVKELSMTLPNEEALEKADGLIFDCNGTLIDSFPVYSKAWAAGFSLSGVTMSDV